MSSCFAQCHLVQSLSTLNIRTLLLTLFAVTVVPIALIAQTTLSSFDSADGAYPLSALTFGPNGDLFGTTVEGGSAGKGTAFEFTTDGAIVWCISFTGANGGNPRGELVLGDDGNFYGTAQ